MIITCEQCNTSFNLDENLLNDKGSKVRCSKCMHIFVAYPPVPPAEETDAPVEEEAGSPTSTPMAAVVGTAISIPTNPRRDPNAKRANINPTGCRPTLEPTSRG